MTKPITNGHKSGSATLATLAAARLQNIAAGQFSHDVRLKAKLCLLDILSAGADGLASEVSDIIAQYTALNVGQEQSYVFGMRKMTSAETAAFANAVLAHYAARDDMHLDSCSHMGSMVIPAALAVAQRDDWTGEQLIRGIVGGYEMGALLGTAFRKAGGCNPHLRASGLIGAFAASGALLAGSNSTTSTCTNALGLAANMACGMNQWAWTDGQEIFLHNGFASRAGVCAFDLAIAGLRGSDSVLEGKSGYFAALGASPSAAVTFEAWLNDTKPGHGILDVRFKPAACCNFTQTTSALAARMRSRTDFKLEDVDTIDITTTTAAISYPGCDCLEGVQSVTQAKMSIQYGICAALVLGQLDDIAFRSFEDKSIVALMRKCRLQVQPDFDIRYEQGFQPATLSVALRDRQVLEESALDVPWLDAKDVCSRFCSSNVMLVEGGEAVGVMEKYLALENVTHCRTDLMLS